MRNAAMQVGSPDAALTVPVGSDARAHVDPDGRLVEFDLVPRSRPRPTGIIRFVGRGPAVARPLQATRLPVRWRPDSQGRHAVVHVI